MARAKYCSAPSKRCTDCSSEVRSTLSASNSSGPISFWPPVPRVAVSRMVPHPLAPVEHGEQAVVLVVRVRGRLEEDADVAELPEGDAECGAAALWRRAALLGGGGQNGRDHRRGDEERERLAHMRVRDRGSGIRDQGTATTGRARGPEHRRQDTEKVVGPAKRKGPPPAPFSILNSPFYIPRSR